MNEETTNHSKYLQQKQKLDEINQLISKNGTEIGNLEIALSEAQSSLQLISESLKNASADLAIGDLSTDGFLSLKQEHYDQENKLKALNDAIQEQKNAREILLNERNSVAGNLNGYKLIIADEINKKLFNEFVGNERLKKLIYSYFAIQDHRRFTRQQYKETLFQFLGFELCNKVFWDENNGVSAIPDIHQAKEKTDELIEELAGI